MAENTEKDEITPIDLNYDMSVDKKSFYKMSDSLSLSSLSSFSSGLSNNEHLQDLELDESLGEYPTSHYNSENSFSNMIRSVSDYEISTNQHRKKIKLDPDDLKEGSTASTFLRNLGNWFRGSTRSTRSVPNQKSSNDIEVKSSVDGIEDQSKSTKTKSLSSSEMTLHTSSLPDKVAPRKVLHLNRDLDLKVLIKDKSSSESSPSQKDNNDVDDGNFSQDSFDEDVTEYKTEKAVDSTTSDVYTTTLESNICFELRSEDPIICRSWKRQFRNVQSVRVIQKSAVKHEINADAFIIPGNSFGILDGWPEIQFVDLFGWKIQDRIKEVIQRDYDGELLVGQSILLPRSEKASLEEENIGSPVATSSPFGADAPSQFPCCNLNVKYLIYVPVMRVPLHVDNTANAYLAFKSAIKSVTRHNEKNKEDPVRIVVCPELCADFGKMPPHRIAYQMKLAFDTFALDRRPDIKMPADLGHMATEHVRMTTSSEGSWF